MRKMTCFVMALALVLGFSQCKKEQLEPENEGKHVMITLNVGGSVSTGSAADGSKVEVNPPQVSFEEGDQILVASGGKYVGTLTKNGTTFSGSVYENDLEVNQPLYFYFFGNKQGALENGATTCTVNISDQTNELPVISMGESIDSNGNSLNYTQGTTSFTARLHNHCSLMKFNVNTSSTAPICITGMNNQVTVNFADPTGTTNGFTYGKEDDGILMMVGGNSAERWLIVLPQEALGETGDAYSVDYAYFGTRPVLSAIITNQYYSSGVSMTVNTPAWDGDLSKLTEGVSERYATATDGMTISGTLAADVKVSIADGATVTLDGANINNNSKSGSSNFAGITCLGNATLNLEGGSIINCASAGYPGIQAGPSGKTLTIQGTGSLSAQGGSNAPGIGGGNEITCGNISLLSGTISACGGQYGAGIGSGQGGSCGNIDIQGSEITANGGDGAAGIGSGSGVGSNINTGCGGIFLNGGKINACGGQYGAGIGSGQGGSCGNIDIQEGEITANGGYGAAGIGSGSGEGSNINTGCGGIFLNGGKINACGGQYGAGIGSGQGGSCGNIDIQEGEITANGGYGAAGIGTGQGGICGNIEIEVDEITATGGQGASNIGAGNGGICGALSGLFSVSNTKQVRFSRGNLQSDGSFAVNQYTYGNYFSASNSYNGPDGWDALTTEEWSYLYQNHTCGFATVNDIHGLIILPDNYTGSAITAYDPEDGSRELWNDNTYSGDAWTAMENNGVVFLPAAGYFYGEEEYQGDEGNYLTSSSRSSSVCFKFENKKAIIWSGFGSAPWSTSITPNYQGDTRYQYSVRLVRTEQAE